MTVRSRLTKQESNVIADALIAVALRPDGSVLTKLAEELRRTGNDGEAGGLDLIAERLRSRAHLRAALGIGGGIGGTGDKGETMSNRLTPEREREIRAWLPVARRSAMGRVYERETIECAEELLAELDAVRALAGSSGGRASGGEVPEGAGSSPARSSVKETP